jgi:hypothetical protein
MFNRFGSFLLLEKVRANACDLLSKIMSRRAEEQKSEVVKKPSDLRLRHGAVSRVTLKTAFKSIIGLFN